MMKNELNLQRSIINQIPGKYGKTNWASGRPFSSSDKREILF
tara:strand:- start:398 stop:523 length:126 start_codon:yes stop_codon:yes gene_type:complete